MKRICKILTLLTMVMTTIITTSCGHDDEPTPPSQIVKCKITCEVEYPETAYIGETVEIKLLSIKVEPESLPGPYVTDAVLWVNKDLSEEKPWNDKPLTFKVKITEEEGIFFDFVFSFKMSDDLQTYNSNIYKIKVLKQ